MDFFLFFIFFYFIFYVYVGSMRSAGLLLEDSSTCSLHFHIIMFACMSSVLSCLSIRLHVQSATSWLYWQTKDVCWLGTTQAPLHAQGWSGGLHVLRKACSNMLEALCVSTEAVMQAKEHAKLWKNCFTTIFSHQEELSWQLCTLRCSSTAFS